MMIIIIIIINIIIIIIVIVSKFRKFCAVNRCAGVSRWRDTMTSRCRHIVTSLTTSLRERRLVPAWRSSTPTRPGVGCTSSSSTTSTVSSASSDSLQTSSRSPSSTRTPSRRPPPSSSRSRRPLTRHRRFVISAARNQHRFRHRTPKFEKKFSFE